MERWSENKTVERRGIVARGEVDVVRVVDIVDSNGNTIDRNHLYIPNCCYKRGIMSIYHLF